MIFAKADIGTLAVANFKENAIAEAVNLYNLSEYVFYTVSIYLYGPLCTSIYQIERLACEKPEQSVIDAQSTLKRKFNHRCQMQ